MAFFPVLNKHPKLFFTFYSNSRLPSGAWLGCICVCLMTLSEGRVYIWEEGEGFADVFHMLFYSYIVIFVTSPAQIPADSPHMFPEARCFVCSAGSFRENVPQCPFLEHSPGWL